MERGVFWLVIALGMITSCASGTSDPPPDGGQDAGDLAGLRLLSFPPVTVQPGDDVQGICQSVTLDNDEEIWVNEIHMSAGPGWHHSNWMWVPEDTFEGPDGTWPCRSRSFDEIRGNLEGGNVFFAQSTQATEETQRFRPGAAFRIPPRAKVIGSIHLINIADTPLDTEIAFRVRGLPRAEVSSLLRGLAIDNRGIRIDPRSRTEVNIECDLTGATANAGPLDFSVYYVLPHYHAYADGLRIEVFGGPRDGQVVFETSGGVGNALGLQVEPPLSLADASGLRVTCMYTNDGPDTVTYGLEATDEMCTVLAYTDSRLQFGGLGAGISSTETLTDGTISHRSGCLAIGRPDSM